ncbi:hypothetical protein BX666DRAFT_1987966 [Dichotomocladium elegans]|nr:hypothetical protein BX666DRAFT_1987966 [Dichotomocladium elegans]
MNSIVTAVVIVLICAVGGMYLDTRYHVCSDIYQLRVVITALIRLKIAIYRDRINIYYLFSDKAKKNPDRVFMYFERNTYTYRDLEQASNRLAHWLILAQNVKRKDVVCMMQQNHPSFVITWLAILKIGAVPSLLNTELKGEGLLHCIRVSSAGLLLFDPCYVENVKSAGIDQLRAIVNIYAFGEGYTEEFPMLTEEILTTYSCEDTDGRLLHVERASDPAMLIYTSGTTGLPKAALIPHYRLYGSFWIMSAIQNTRPTDITYTCLPLYHSSGLIVSFGSTLVGGGAIVLSRKFSASTFWNDVYDYKVTLFHYVGELCRYLVNQPRHPLENKHCVRLILGNGMRQEIWKPLRTRFNIATVVEFYGATEGLGAFFNYSKGGQGEGAIGRHGPLMRTLSNTRFIKVDPITQEPARDEQGFCIACAPGEAGEMLAKIDAEGIGAFTGYYGDRSATEKKVLRNVFTRGDMYFRSGDLIRFDTSGYIYFEDRLGDTFRWHSQNVATTEVAHVIAEFPGIAEVNVYGTLVPKHDGRAGMAAIVLSEDVQAIDLIDFFRHVSKHLPRYAIPVFLRFMPKLDMTATFKQQKHMLREQGIDRVPPDEPVFWLHDGEYRRFQPADLAFIQSGKARI